MKFVFVLLLFLKWSNCFLKTYDFIIVGSGAGGSVVARRLAENRKFSVLLVESGTTPIEDSKIPALAPRYISNAESTFRFQSVPQKYAALKNNGILTVVSGNMYGGSSSLNFMWFNRGSPKDYDNWANVTGDPSWKYENMLKYMKRSENYEGDFPSEQHGFTGPITVSRTRYAPGLNDYWFPAGRELGYPVADPNGPQIRGFSPVEFSKRRGRRVSSFSGYVEPILKARRNLDVLGSTNVTEILFEGKRAIGVRTSSSGIFPNNCVYAAKEVIVSAGSYNSPILLQRSGIGPRQVLRDAGIPVVKELPVGENLQDHSSITISFVINNASVVFDEDRDLTPRNREYYELYGDGPFSVTRGSTGQAFISSSVTSSEGHADWPDLHLCMGHSTTPLLVPPENLNLKRGEVPMSSAVFLGRPKSRGSIRIGPMAGLGNVSPILDQRYLTDSRDMQILLDGIKETLRIYENTAAYRKLGTRLVLPTLPACQRFPIRSDSYWKCFIQQNLGGGCHPAGSNKMGRKNDPTAVVDPELRVIGIRGLRIVDASIMPFITNANPQAVVYAIAEKASDMILSDWQDARPIKYH